MPPQRLAHLNTILENLTMNSLFKIAIVCTLLLLGSCSHLKHAEAPATEGFARSNQKHLQASQHWSVIADDLATQVKQALIDKKFNTSTIYISPDQTTTKFNQAFYDFLLTSLVKKNIKVSRVYQKTDLPLEYKINTVRFNANRNVLTTAKWTSLAAGLVVMRNGLNFIDGAIDSLERDAITTAIGVDAYNAGLAPNVEVVISTSIVKGNAYVLRNTDIYYANTSDAQLYDGAKRKSSVFNDEFYQ